MKVVLKPGGVFLVTGILMVLMLTVIVRLRPAMSPALPAAKPLRLDESLMGIDTAAGTFATRRETLPGATKAVTVYAVQTLKPVKNPWEVATHITVAEPLSAKTSLRLVFSGRSAHSGEFSANHEEGQTPFAKSLAQTIKTTPEWKEFSLPFRTTRDYAAGKSQLAFHCGFAPGTIEIADVRLLQDKP